MSKDKRGIDIRTATLNIQLYGLLEYSPALGPEVQFC